MEFNPSNQPHRRYNPLIDEWVLVSPQRTKRPWLGRTETHPWESRPQFDPTCYLCPGNERAGGQHNAPYRGVYLFANDFSALLPESAGVPADSEPLLRAVPEEGTC